MTSIDLSDLHGTFPTPLRWSAENGVLGFGAYDSLTGDRTIEPIELGSELAKVIVDTLTRERGYGLIRKGLYDMRLTPVGSPPPEWPGDDDFKPAVGCWLWNPMLGELRLETNAAIFRDAVSGLWDRVRTYKEAVEGQVPVICFVDRVEREIPAIGKTFWAPVIDIIRFVPRDRVPCFAARKPTVPPPLLVDSQVRHALLARLEQPLAPQQVPEPPPKEAPKVLMEVAGKTVTDEDIVRAFIPEPPPGEEGLGSKGRTRTEALRAKLNPDSAQSTERAPAVQPVGRVEEPSTPVRRPGRPKSAVAVETLSAVQEHGFAQLLAAAAKTPNHGGWSKSELFNQARLYGKEITSLLESGRLEQRGERYYPPRRKQKPLEELLDDQLPDDPIPEL
jgi:hypothetical protein